MKLLARLDGVLIDPDVPILTADDLGVLRGDGVFETLLAIGGQPRDLTEHLARLRVSADLLDIEIPPTGDWHCGIDAVLAGAGAAEFTLRLVATRGRESGSEATCFVMTAPVPAKSVAARSGVTVVTLPRGIAGAEVATMPWLLAGAKCLSYAVNIAAQRYAVQHGAEDAIFIGSDGHVLEGATATVVLARGRTLVTPPADGILAGITVRRLFHQASLFGWLCEEAPLTTQDLLAADGVWLVSSVRLLAPVTRINDIALPKGEATEELFSLLMIPV